MAGKIATCPLCGHYADYVGVLSTVCSVIPECSNFEPPTPIEGDMAWAQSMYDKGHVRGLQIQDGTQWFWLGGKPDDQPLGSRFRIFDCDLKWRTVSPDSLRPKGEHE